MKASYCLKPLTLMQRPICRLAQTTFFFLSPASGQCTCYFWVIPTMERSQPGLLDHPGRAAFCFWLPGHCWGNLNWGVFSLSALPILLNTNIPWISQYQPASTSARCDRGFPKADLERWRDTSNEWGLRGGRTSRQKWGHHKHSQCRWLEVNQLSQQKGWSSWMHRLSDLS